MQKKIILRKAKVDECDKIHEMQIEAFSVLLDKYKDYDTSPARETIEDVKKRLAQNNIDNYFTCLNNKEIGVIRVAKLGKKSRLSSIFLLPQYQNRGYGEQAIWEVERLYPKTEHWELDTIKQESRLCHFYEKMGYVATGQEKNIQEGMTIVFYDKYVLSSTNIDM